MSHKVNLVEAPSTRLAVRQYLERLDKKLTITYQINGVPSPDPRDPQPGCTDPLWRYPSQWLRRSKEAEVAVAPPDPQVANAVAAIAATPYQVDTWNTRARETAERFGPSMLPSFCSVMVHPPPPPPDVVPWVWIPKVQVAAALAIAGLDRGWEDSVRRKALLSLARGPLDWTTEAAIIALAAVARVEPAAVADVQAMFRDLMERIPTTGHCCYEHALVCCWLQLPELSPGDNEWLREWRTRLEGEGT